jgi:hypothetical protein
MKKNFDKEKFILERRRLIKSQPTTQEITGMLKKVLSKEITQDEASDWACNYLINDDLFEVTDYSAWDYLKCVGCLGLLSPNEYLYFDEDIESWINEYDNSNNKKL